MIEPGQCLFSESQIEKVAGQFQSFRFITVYVHCHHLGLLVVLL